MRTVIFLTGILVLATMACGSSTVAQEQPVNYLPAPELTTWATPEDELSEDKLIYPISVFQEDIFPTLNLEEPRKYVTFTKGADGRYYGTIHGIEFIVEMH